MNRDEIGGHRLPGLQASRQLDSLTSPERMTDSDDETLKRPQRGAQQWATSLQGVTQREALVVPQATQESLPSHPVHLSAHREQVADQHTHQMQDVEAVPARQESAPPPPDTPSPTRLRATSWFQRSKRVPVLHQVSVVECGAACLAMVLSYHGRKTSISEVHEHCGLGRDGLSARNLAEAARQYGLRVRAISLEENDFRFVPLPAIVHWQFNHFLVVERWSPKVVEVVDPAVGRKRLSAREFDEGFTGVVLMLEPGVHFQRENRPARLSLQTYVKSYLKQAPGAVVQVLGASLLLEVLGLVFPVLTAVVVDQLIPLKMLSALTLFGFGMILLVLAQLVVRLLRASVLLYVQAHVDLHMMLNFVEHLLSLPQRFFLERSSGDLLNRISSNVVIRDTVSQQLFSTLLDGSFVITYFLILLSQSLLFSSVVVVIGALQVILLLCTNQQIGELTSRELAAQGRSEGYLTEVLTGVRTLKAAGAEQRVMERWSNLFVDQMNISVRYSYVSSLIDTALSTLSICSPLVLLWLGTMQAITGAMQIGTMLALAALANAILMPLASFVLAVQQVQVVRSHLDRIADVVEAEPEQKLQAVSSPPRLRGEIRLDQVSFQYDPNSPMVLRDINAHIQPGQKVALVGRSGSGKSTLGNLLLGLYLPTRGQILYDGIPLQTLNYQQVRAQFGVVTQEASVFSGSIRENIALNDPSMEMEQVIRAAQLAALHDDILQMPMEYETLVSEGGNALSGGQRQRLAIARALAHAPAILLLDEATSNLDVITEQTVGQNLQQSCCTQIIIAHRLSTIRETDVILVLDQGTLVEQGSHQELLRRHGYYAHLIKNQLATGEIEGFEAAS